MDSFIVTLFSDIEKNKGIINFRILSFKFYQANIITDFNLLPQDVSLNSISRTQCSMTSVSVGAKQGETDDECVWCIEERPGPVFPDIMPHKMSLSVMFLPNLVSEKYPEYPRVPRMFSRSKEVQGGVSLVGL